MTKPVIVTGCGRSGTHLVGHIMREVFGFPEAAWEPGNYLDIGEIVVDSRLRHRVKELEANGHRVVHLVRDGRDVVRSLHQWYRMRKWIRAVGSDDPLDGMDANDLNNFERCCTEWRDAIDMMNRFPVLHIEDLSKPRVRDASLDYSLPHWTEWGPGLTDTFWRICGDQMRRMEYGE